LFKNERSVSDGKLCWEEEKKRRTMGVLFLIWQH
jgi:hypothetical protein